MTFGAGLLLAAMTVAEAIATLLNSPASSSPARYARAEEMVRRDADAGKPLQQFVIGVTTKDKELAARYLDAARPRIRRLAEKTGNPLAWYLLSMETNDFTLLRRAADGGNVQALNALGTIAVQSAFDRSLGTNALERVLAKGFDCFRRAAAAQKPPDANALVNLGTCYFRGFGCEVNLELAHECFRTAAKLGHPEAMDYLSANYEHGHGVAKNAELSLFWRMKAKAVRGDESALKWLREWRR